MDPRQEAIAKMQSKLGRVALVQHALGMFLESMAYDECPESASLMCHLVHNTLEGDRTTINKGDPTQVEGARMLRAVLTPQHKLWEWIDVVDEPVEAMAAPVEGQMTDADHEDALAGLDDADPLESDAPPM